MPWVTVKLHRISIHALREEGDSLPTPQKEAADTFLSTPSARRATSSCAARCRCDRISIHALREEGDSMYFCWYLLRLCISIHALREEGDCQGVQQCNARVNFYPRPPRGGRPSW